MKSTRKSFLNYTQIKSRFESHNIINFSSARDRLIANVSTIGKLFDCEIPADAPLSAYPEI